MSALGAGAPPARALARVGQFSAAAAGANRGSTPAMLIAVAAGGLALGALLEYLLDPRVGRRRRHRARDRALSRLRRGERRALVRARRAESHAIGVARRTINARRRAEEPLDDLTLAQKVESQLFAAPTSRRVRSA